MNQPYFDPQPHHPNTPPADTKTFATWEHRQYAAPPGSVGSAGPHSAHQAWPSAQVPSAYGDGVPYPAHRGYPQQPAAQGDGVPYPGHRGHPSPRVQRSGYPQPNPRGYPQARPSSAHPAYGHQSPPAAYPKASDPSPSMPSPSTGEVHIRNRVASPREAKEKRTSWFLIGLTAFFLVWVFAAALFIFNQMNIL